MKNGAKKLSLEELKMRSASDKLVTNLEAIVGGSDISAAIPPDEEYCHNGYGKS